MTPLGGAHSSGDSDVSEGEPEEESLVGVEKRRSQRQARSTVAPRRTTRQ